MEKLEYLKDLFNQKKSLIILGGITLIIILGISVFIVYKNIYSKKDNSIKRTEEIVTVEKQELEEKEEVKKCEVTVDIKGEINIPGVYKVECDKRINDQTTLNMIQDISSIIARKPMIIGEI